MAKKLVDVKTMVPIPQDDSATCWHAGYRMMFQYKGKSATVENLLKAEIGAEAYENCKQNGLLRKYWGNAVYAFDMLGHSGRASTEFSYVQNLLDTCGPVLFHYTRSKGIHTIVLIGYDEDTENIWIIDPWWDDGTPKAASTYPIAFSAVNTGIKGSDGWAGVLQHW